MFRNYLTVTLRFLKKDRLFSAIRLGNLVIGLTVALLCWIYIDYEMSYENAFHNRASVYRLQQQTPEKLWAAGPRAAGVYAYENFPEVISMVRLAPMSSLVSVGEDTFQEDNIMLCDSTIFEVFNYERVSGDLKTALNRPQSVVLTESTARRYFGDEDAVGKVIMFDFDDGRPMQVTAVIKDPPTNSHIQFDLLASIYADGEGYKEYNRSWSNWGTYAYVLLRDNSDTQKLAEGLVKEFRKQYKLDEENFFEVKLMPLEKIHLHSNAEKEFSVNANVKYIYIFGFAGLFVLIVSTVNFVNLTVARSIDRAKEVGLRKTVGASPFHVGAQFFTETYLQIITSGVLAVALVYFLLPFFRQLSGLPLPFAIFGAGTLSIIVWIMLTIGLIAGAYPAWLASRYRPVAILNNRQAMQQRGSVSIRQWLSIAQFVISIILIVGSMVIYKQSMFIRQKDLGFQKDQILIGQISEPMHESLDSFESELRRITGVTEVSHSSAVPGYRIMREDVTNISSGIAQTMRLLLVGESFIETFDLDFVKGSTFSRNLPEGKRQWIINEEAERVFFENKDADPIGQKLSWARDTSELVGVVRNFNFETLHESVSPLAICLIPEWAERYLSIRFEPARTEDVLEGVRKVYSSLYPNLPMLEPEFLDDRFEHLYEAENKLQSLVLIFCTISIVLTISGIFALATYYTQRRAKEIAVRKVLGSSVGDILKLLSRRFVGMVAVSVCLALPLSYYLNDWWLAQFAYKVNFGFLPYLTGSLTILIIVLMSTSYSTIKAALTNPVRWLRDS